MTILKQKDVDEYQQSLEKNTARQAEIKTLYKSKEGKIASIQVEIKNFQDTCDTLRKQVSAIEAQLKTLASEYNPLNKEVYEAEQALANHQHATKVKELFDKQTDFYTALERELVKQHEELTESVGDFVKLVDPAVACSKLRNIIENGGISEANLVVRSGKTNYDQCITDLCERKIRGDTIDISVGTMPVQIVKNWLQKPSVTHYWRS